MLSSPNPFRTKNKNRFSKLLLRWYYIHQRKLPWRGERDPYRILVSEIMLQQTRVAVVEDRYRRFIARFPTVGKLARASEQSVLAAWSGLGYYRRARNLRAAAKQLRAAGKFPVSAAALHELPGIGRYTANAVASIASGEPVAVVDGNVKRVLGRIFAMEFSPAAKAGEERYWQLATELLDRRNPGDFNQAIMELGALVCLPLQPMCSQCPVAALCCTRGPVAREARQARRKAVQHYALVRRRDRVLLSRRPHHSSLMPGMWELPLLPEQSTLLGRPLLTLRHSITTTDYTIFVHAASTYSANGSTWYTLRSAKRLPLTGLARKILEKLDA